MNQPARLLVVEDEKVALRNLLHVLRKEGYEVIGAHSGTEALRRVEEQRYDLVITDLRMERVDGMQVLQRCKALYPDTEVIVITGHATVTSAVDAMKAGAFHYISKPFRLDEVRHVVREALEVVRLRVENAALRALVDEYTGNAKIVTQHPVMRRLLETARQVAPTDCSVLITGESGTGKELLARYLHSHSDRAKGPFVAVNCGAFTEELLANELFGHEKGAYTGATERRSGLIEAADGGTLFLDEVTEMSQGMQVKLLRVLQENELYRVGANRPVQVDTRYIAATNRDVHEMLASGRFRQDLYFRLNVVNLRVPPLSERREDIPLLAHYFLRKHAQLMERPVHEIEPDVMSVLAAYDFPGNVRELENLIARGVALAPADRLTLEQLPEDLVGVRLRALRSSPDALPTLEAQEAEYIRWVLEQTHGNRTRAAEILGIDRVSLWRKLKKHGLQPV